MRRTITRSIVTLLLAGVLLISVTVVAGAAKSQVWHLDSPVHPSAGRLMESTTGAQSGTVDLPKHEEQIWLAEHAAERDVAFPSGGWLAELEFCSQDAPPGPPYGKGNVKVSIGGWNPSTGWYDFPTWKQPTTWVNNGILKVLVQKGPVTVWQGDYLAVKIENMGPVSRVLCTDGSSTLSSPSTDPGYPLPELPTVILLGGGLAGLVGYYGLRRSTVSARV
jgi:hypothetical protein